MVGIWLLTIILYTPVAAQKNIAFADGLNHKKEIKLNKAASDVTYIPLETTAESLLDKDIMAVVRLK